MTGLFNIADGMRNDLTELVWLDPAPPVVFLAARLPRLTRLLQDRYPRDRQAAGGLLWQYMQDRGRGWLTIDERRRYGSIATAMVVDAVRQRHGNCPISASEMRH